jgi:hypothetical protein
MRYKDLNNKGLYSMRMNDFMQTGGQPIVQENTNMMEEIIPAIKSALDQGTPLVEVIIALLQNQVPIEVVQESLMSAGISQEEFMAAVQELQQSQAQAQAQSESIESPVEPGSPQEMEGSMPQGMPIAQMGGSTPSLDDPKYIEMLKSYGTMVDYSPADKMYSLTNYNDPENVIMQLRTLPSINEMEEWRILDLLPSDMDVYNMQSKYMKGGEKYSNVLNKAQYGLGMANPASLSQYYGMLEDPSYRPNIKSAYLPMNLKSKGNLYGALSTLGESAGRLFGTAENNEGLAVGAFRDLKAKKAAHETNKAEKYNYDVNIDPNDPNVYSGSAVDLYRASSENPFRQAPLRTMDEYMREGNVKYNPETMDYTFMSAPQSKYNDEGFEGFGSFQDRMQSLPEETKKQLKTLATDIDVFKNTQQNLPEGTEFGVNKFGQSVYYTPGTDTSDSQSQMNARLMGYAFKNGGSYNNPGFKALPPQVQAKIMKAQMGTEMSAPMEMFNNMMSAVSQNEKPGRKYKNLSPHVKTNDEIELTTEQIAKIMAAGGSVKIL